MPVLLFLLLTLLPALGQEDSADQITLNVVLNDTVAHRVTRPELRFDLAGSEAVPLVDDGSLGGDIPGDAIWHGLGLVRRVQRLELEVVDVATGESLGGTAVFLPAAGEATIKLRTTQGDPALMLEEEGGGKPFSDGAPPTTTSGSTQALTASGEKFDYLLWLLALLGLLGFGYLRLVVRRLYLRDLLPTWRKLDRWLDQQLDD